MGRSRQTAGESAAQAEKTDAQMRELSPAAEIADQIGDIQATAQNAARNIAVAVRATEETNSVAQTIAAVVSWTFERQINLITPVNKIFL